MSEVPNPKGTRPTHELKILDMETEDTAQVGVAWARDNGFISIKLNPGVTLSYDNMKGKVLTLFKARTPEEWEAIRTSRQATEPQGPLTRKSGYDGNGGTWKDNHPQYVRKVHFFSATRSQCPQRTMGKPELSDDPSKVTCKKCKEIAQRTGRQATMTPIQPEPPKEPTPAA